MRASLSYLSLSALLLPLIFLHPAVAQDVPTNAPISVDMPVFDTISDAAPFDIWEFSAATGEQYRVEMQAADGLAPLLGLRAPSGDIIVASNQFEDGSTQDADPDALAMILFEIYDSGDYALVATRVGTDNGNTQGSYTLYMSRIADAPLPDETYVDVTFRCGTAAATTAAVVSFRQSAEQQTGYQISVYGFEGFDPVIRLGEDGRTDAPCELSAPLDDPLAFEFGLGDRKDLTFSAADVTGMAHIALPAGDAEPVRVTVGSRGGASGRFALQISGLAIESAGELDFFTLRNGPFAKDQPLIIWMLRDGLSRLDPLIMAPEDVISCADIGLRSCSDGLKGASIRVISDGEVSFMSSHLDSVARVEASGTAPIELTAASQNPRTTGEYMLWFVGTLTSAP